MQRLVIWKDSNCVLTKQSRYCAEEARANIGYDPIGRVEGVVYELASASEIYSWTS